MAKIICLILCSLLGQILAQLVNQNQPNINEGRYYPSTEGQYVSGQYDNNGGQYVPDDSGRYVPDDSGSYKEQNGRYTSDISGAYKDQDGRYTFDTSSAYRGQIDRFGPRFGGRGTVTIGTGPGIKKTGTVQGVGSGVSAGFGLPIGKQGSATGKYDNRNYAIIRQEGSVLEDGYHYLYETENGIYGEEQGKLENRGTNAEAMRASGYFSYTGPDNVIYTVTYTADENGFQPQGDHLPKSILRGLEYQRTHNTR